MKIYFDMVGCRLNQAEIENLAQKFYAHGDEIISDADQADLIIINTCCVTAKAAADSRKMIRHYAHNTSGQIIVTGCWGTLFRDEALALPAVKRLVSNADKEFLVEKTFDLSDTDLRIADVPRIPVEGLRKRTRAFIKVQDGCDQHCTYCLTRIARGKSYSITPEIVLKSIDNAVSSGAKEVVLTGVQLGAWGKDLPDKITIAHLLRTIFLGTQIQRVRLSSIEPWDIDQNLIEVFGNSRLCPHLHIPLQSGSESTLRRMARKTSPGKYEFLIYTIKKHVPDIAITTDLIVGFPGETDMDFEDSLNFVSELQLAGGHVFSYSAMAGTPAANFPFQVPAAVKKQRSQKMREILLSARISFMQDLIGKEVSVLWEKSELKIGHYYLSGLTDTYMPIKVRSKIDLYNQISQVLITDMINDKFLEGTL